MFHEEALLSESSLSLLIALTLLANMSSKGRSSSVFKGKFGVSHKTGLKPFLYSLSCLVSLPGPFFFFFLLLLSFPFLASPVSSLADSDKFVVIIRFLGATFWGQI
ncbi:hypothetical protein OIU77_006855 [Salix suchowensis]|uniref:Uncharacterized protein n=1 Tax=Salix suchowensis TaxID=1278906 RepID=A0ABQ9AM40_9ROSI|nr:hypothetical protein OIU77_006855 [Salix suchowensis]